MKLNYRNLGIAAAVVIIILAVYSYLPKSSNKNTKSETKKTQTSASQKQISTTSAVVKSSSLVSSTPASGSSVSAPTEVSIKFDKKVSAGSEIKVASDKGVDVVPSANKLSTDLLTLSAPVAISSKGVYKVSYSVNFSDGTVTSGSYSFTVK